MKDIENRKVIEKEFDIKLNPGSTSPSPVPSRSPTPQKKNKKNKKIIRKRNKKKELSENNSNNNNATPEFNSEHKDINDNNTENDNNGDKSQMKITNFTIDKKNIENTNNIKKLNVSAIYGEDNVNSGGNKMNELNKIKKSKKGKKVKMYTQNLINDLNNMDKNGNEYDFEFLNKYEKFDNETNSMFDLFTAPKKNKNNITNDNIFDGNNLMMNISKNNKKENKENNPQSDLGFLNAIEDLNKYL